MGWPREGKIVVYTGRLVSYKGLPLLLQVWQRLQEELPGLQLVLVGEGGLDIHNCEAELRGYVSAHTMAASVIFTGGVSNVHDYLQAADIFVLPTENEAFGISLIEAMACGLPVVSTAVGGVKDILQPGVNGLVVEPADFEQLFQALHTLLTDEALAGSLGSAALQAARERYGTAAVVGRFADLFTRVKEGA